MRLIQPAFAAAAVLALSVSPLSAAKLKDTKGDKPIAELSEDILGDTDRVAEGKEIWIEQCAHCHGAKAYPGKAPKLKPRKYTPAFVYDRITYGFRKMPAWEEVYTESERQSLVAWIMNAKFSP